MHRRDRRFRNDSTVLFHRFPSNLALAPAVERGRGREEGKGGKEKIKGASPEAGKREKRQRGARSAGESAFSINRP